MGILICGKGWVNMDEKKKSKKITKAESLHYLQRVSEYRNAIDITAWTIIIVPFIVAVLLAAGFLYGYFTFWS